MDKELIKKAFQLGYQEGLKKQAKGIPGLARILKLVRNGSRSAVNGTRNVVGRYFNNLTGENVRAARRAIERAASRKVDLSPSSVGEILADKVMAELNYDKAIRDMARSHYLTGLSLGGVGMVGAYDQGKRSERNKALGSK